VTDSRRALIVVENSYVPFDIRVWSEATTLRDVGWQVTVLCPMAPSALPGDATPGAKASGQARTPEMLEGVAVYRFPVDGAQGEASSYLGEYLSAFLSIASYSWYMERQRL
jgi:hypothetical protein